MSSKNIINLKKKLSIMDIKSKFILKKILSYLNENKFLHMIHYNKALQNLLKKNIKDFKNYSIIELEITPLEVKDMKFINIYKDKSYYHIYLDGYLYNDNKLEGHNARKIKIILDHEIK